MRHRASFLLAPVLALSACSDPAAPQQPELVASTSGTSFGVAAEESIVYFTVAGAGGVEEGPDGKVLKLVSGAEEPVEVATGLPDPFAITLAADQIIWTELGTSDADGTVRTVGKNGGTPSALASAQAGPRQVVSDGDRAFWIDSGGRVLRAQLPDGEIEEVPDARAASIALSDEHVYWTDPDAGTVMRAPKALGNPEEVASQQPRPRGIAVSPGHVWWTVLGAVPLDGDEDEEDEDSGAPTGELRSVPIDGGGVQTLATRQTFTGLNAIVADDVGVYWLVDDAGTSSVSRVLLPGGTPEIIAAGRPEGAPGDLPTSVFDITTDASYVYWTTSDGLTGRVLRASK